MLKRCSHFGEQRGGGVVCVFLCVCVCRCRVHSAQPPSTGSLFKIHIYFIACDLFKLRFNYPPFVCACSMRFALENENYQFWMSHNQLARCMRMHLTGGNLAIRPHITNFPLIFDLSLSLSPCEWVFLLGFRQFSEIESERSSDHRNNMQLICT